MGRPLSNRPTDAEFEILQVLWTLGTATIRDIHDELTPKRPLAYTSLATIARILVDKGMVEIFDHRRPQRFKAIISEEEARKAVTDDWLERMFSGSVANLMRHALTGRKCSTAEKEELRTLIEQSTKLAPRFSNPIPSRTRR